MIDMTFDMFIETEVPENELIISRTDLKGIITYVNDTFAEISGYAPSELIGQPHSIVRHPDMPKSTFKEVWQSLEVGKSWSGFIKNIRKDRGYYWVEADISGIYKDGKLVAYKSVRAPMREDKKIQMQKYYDRLRKEEEGNVRVVMYTTSDKLDQLSKF